MGFKIAALTAPAGETSLEDFVAAVLGHPVSLQDTALTVENILMDNETHACAINGQYWVFDWALIGDWIDTPPLFGSPCVAFMLQSAVNAYGFSVSDGTQVLRKRVGDESGIHIDEGPLLHAEQIALAALTPAGNAGEALAAWSCEEKSFNGAWDGMTHDAIGEDIVFAMMRETVGFSLDQESDKLRRFETSPIQRVTEKKGLLSKLFGGK